MKKSVRADMYKFSLLFGLGLVYFLFYVAFASNFEALPSKFHLTVQSSNNHFQLNLESGVLSYRDQTYKKTIKVQSCNERAVLSFFQDYQEAKKNTLPLATLPILETEWLAD